MKMEEETITNRIVHLMNKEGHTVNTFAKKLNIPWSSANNIITGRNAPNYETIVKILTSFDNIDANWLIMGQKRGEESDVDKLYSVISMQQKTIENQQRTIDRLTAKLVENVSEDSAKKVASAV
jgi:predicted transcriptional regulator